MWLLFLIFKYSTNGVSQETDSEMDVMGWRTTEECPQNMWKRREAGLAEGRWKDIQMQQRPLTSQHGQCLGRNELRATWPSRDESGLIMKEGPGQHPEACTTIPSYVPRAHWLIYVYPAWDQLLQDSGWTHFLGNIKEGFLREPAVPMTVPRAGLDATTDTNYSWF